MTIRLASGSPLKLNACRKSFPDVIGLTPEETGDSFNVTVGGVDMPLTFEEIRYTAASRGTWMMKRYPEDTIIVLESGLVSADNTAWHVTYGGIKGPNKEAIELFSSMIRVPEQYWLYCKLYNMNLVDVVKRLHPDADFDKGSFLSFLTFGKTSRPEQLELLCAQLKLMWERP